MLVAKGGELERRCVYRIATARFRGENVALRGREEHSSPRKLRVRPVSTKALFRNAALCYLCFMLE